MLPYLHFNLPVYNISFDRNHSEPVQYTGIIISRMCNKAKNSKVHLGEPIKAHFRIVIEIVFKSIDFLHNKLFVHIHVFLENRKIIPM